MQGYYLTNDAYRQLTEMYRWWQQHKNIRQKYRRRGGGFQEAAGGVDVKVFEVQSNATGDGVYKCYEQDVVHDNWDDSNGLDKLDDTNTTEVEVLNLEESDPTAGQHNLRATDRLAAFEVDDDEGTTRWVGVCVSAGMIRRAKIQTSGVGTSSLTCKLLGKAGTELGDAITVYPIEHLGTNDLSGNVWPKLAAADNISCFQDVNGTWYTTVPFDDSSECTPP